MDKLENIIDLDFWVETRENRHGILEQFFL